MALRPKSKQTSKLKRKVQHKKEFSKWRKAHNVSRSEGSRITVKQKEAKKGYRKWRDTLASDHR